MSTTELGMPGASAGGSAARGSAGGRPSPAGAPRNDHDVPPTIGVSTGPGTSVAYHTGTWRTERPVYVTLTPPCQVGCPSGEDIRGWLGAAQDGTSGYERAWRAIVENNPLPAVMGRICYHPCQTACNRVELDEAVGINAVERFLGDTALENGWSFDPPAASTGRRVLVVGSGPAGLSTAYHLARLGHEVTIREAAAEAGGMLRYGIPAYRLPRDVLSAEIDRIVALGVRIECSTKVTDLPAVQAEFDAVVLTVGAGVGHHVDIPAGAASKILDAIDVLRDVASDHPPLLGRRVAVYGGGNTAMDAARVARRLGAQDAVIIYRRTQAQMPAHATELHDAIGEGVRVQWLSTIKQIEGPRVKIERMTLDDEGRPVPTGVFEELDADAVLLAVGQDADLSLVTGTSDIDVRDGVVGVDLAGMTGRPGVFAAGDVSPGSRTATFAIGRGALAARSVDAWLAGATPTGPAPVDREAAASRLNTWYYSDAPHQHRRELEAARRVTGFEEVVQGLDAEHAVFEARRCMSCGSCFECDNCFGMCPDDAIIKLGPGRKYEIDLDYCKGCGICANECPCGAIDLVSEVR